MNPAATAALVLARGVLPPEMCHCGQPLNNGHTHHHTPEEGTHA